MNIQAPIAAIGHNKPPYTETYKELNDDLAAHLETGFTNLVKRTEEIVEQFSKAPEVVTKENAGTVSDVIAQITAHVKASDAARTDLVAPVLKAQRQINTWFDDKVFEQLDTPKKTVGIKQKLLQRLTVYEQAVAAEERRRREEEERKAREAAQEAERIANEERRRAAEAAAAIANEQDMAKALAMEQEAAERSRIAREQQAAAEALAKQANAKAADMATVRGAFGSSSSLRTTWVATIESLEKIDLNKLKDFLSEEDIQKALNAYVKLHKDKRPIYGVKFHETTNAVVRG